jgi:hypothetical protein
MAITRIKNNQITDSTITNVKIVSGTLTGDKMNPNLTFNSNLVLNGNLTVTGNVTAVQSTTTQITDPLLTLGLGNAGTSYDLGLILTRGSGGNRFLGWKENQSAFVFINTTEDGLTTGNIPTTAYGNLLFGNATALGATTLGGFTLSGNTIGSAGAMTVRSETGSITLANAVVGQGSVILGSTLSVFDTATVNALISNGAIQGTTLGGSGNATVAALTVNGSATIGTTLGVTGNINGSSATLTGSATIGTTLGVTGNINGSSATLTGSAVVQNSLQSLGGLQATPIGNAVASTGQFTTASATGNITGAAITSNGSITVGTTFSALGAATLASTLSVGSTATVNALTVNNAITAATGTILGNLLVEGNLRVMGNVSYINVDTYTVEDPLIELHTGPNGAPLSLDDGSDVGVRAHYYDTTDRSAFFGYKDSSGFFEYYSNVTSETANVIAGTYGTIKTGNLQLTAAAIVGSTLSVVANATVNALTVNNSATVAGTLGVTGNLNAVNINATNGTFTNNVTVLGNLIATSNVIANTSGIFFGSPGTGLNAIYGGLSTYTLLPNVVAQFTTNINNYSQLNIQNLSSGNQASADLVLTANDGSDVSKYLDLGIASNNYSYAGYGAYGPNDGYLLIDGGNLLLNVESPAKTLKFIVGGYDSSNLVGDFSTSRLAVNVTTASTGSTSGALQVAGGVGIQGTLNVQTAANLGNVTFNNLTISSNVTNTGVTINPNGTGQTVINSGLNNSKTIVNGTTANTLVVSGTQIGVNTATPTTGATMHFATTDSIILPAGAIGNRPATPVAGMFRFSTTTNLPEWYDGTAWGVPSTNFTIVTANTQTGDNTTTVFTIPVANASTAGTIVSINGVVQEPVTAYSISGNVVTFTEAPASTDKIDFRVFVTTQQVTTVTDVAGTTGLFLDLPAENSDIVTFKTNGTESFSIQANSTARFTGNVEPSANVTYNLGSTTKRWKDLWLSGSTIVLGNVQIKESAGQVAFYAADGSTPAPAAFNSIDHAGTTGTGNIGSVSSGFNTVFAKATSAQYADLAENYLGDAYYEPGTVVEFGGANEVTLCDTVMSPRIAGVVSTNPAYLMNSGLEGFATPVALQGRVPCKVVGPVRKGDMMVSAGNGAARAATAPVMGSVIGKALENFDGAAGVIEVVVGRI